MLTADQIDVLRDLSGQVVDPVVNFLIQDIARRIAAAGQVTSTAAYQIWRAQNLGVSQKKVMAQVRKLLGASQDEMEGLLERSAELGHGYDLVQFPTLEAVPLAENTSLQQILDATVQMTREDMSNVTQTMGFVTYDGKCEELTRAYEKSCDFAFMKVVTGAQSYTEAIRDAVRGLAEKGIRSIDYESGVHRSLEAAVRGSIMGGLGLMQEKISQQNHDALGCDGWEISAHAASAPDHEPIQGKQYSDAAYNRLNNSLVRRIGTLNCGHSASPIILGVNSPQYSDEELEEFRRANEEGIEYEGKHYTMYEATQRQRSLERSMRSRKRRILIDEETGDKERLQQDQIRLVRTREEYHRFSKAAGLREQWDRAEAAGFLWKHGKAATAASQKYESDFTLRASSGTMKAINGARITNTYSPAARAHADRYYGLVREMKTDAVRIAKNTGYSEEQIQRIKNFIFVEKHDLGDGEPRRFDPSFAMAQSWQRLINGTPEPHDLTLLKHEIMEKELMDGGMSQHDAHIETSKKHNYGKESDDYYAALKERKNRK